MSYIRRMIDELRNPHTWERVGYFARMKGWEEGRDVRRVKKEDRIPYWITIIIGLSLCLLAMVIAVMVSVR